MSSHNSSLSLFAFGICIASICIWNVMSPCEFGMCFISIYIWDIFCVPVFRMCFASLCIRDVMPPCEFGCVLPPHTFGISYLPVHQRNILPPCPVGGREGLAVEIHGQSEPEPEGRKGILAYVDRLIRFPILGTS